MHEFGRPLAILITIHVTRPVMTIDRNQLLNAAQKFCEYFASKKDVDSVLELFSTTHERTVFEHGDPSLAPFLGRPFVGLAVRKYFEMIDELLDYDAERLRFVEFVVDKEKLKVFVKGEGKFTWKSTGQTWEESFAYALDFDDELKVTDYEIWADSGAAFLARIGKLDEVKAVPFNGPSLKFTAMLQI